MAKKSIYEAKFLKDFCLTADNMYRLGWDERNGGNISLLLETDEVLEYLGTDRQYNEDEKPDVSIEVPDVRGLSLDEAEKKIVDAGLKYTVSGDKDAETAGAQLPKPGVMVDEDSLVILYTDEEADEAMVEVPDVKGLDVDSARERLLYRNLNFEVAGAGHSEASGAYAVNQSVAPGEKVSPGTVIGVEFRQEATD